VTVLSLRVYFFWDSILRWQNIHLRRMLRSGARDRSVFVLNMGSALAVNMRDDIYDAMSFNVSSGSIVPQ